MKRLVDGLQNFAREVSKDSRVNHNSGTETLRVVVEKISDSDTEIIIVNIPRR